MICAQVAFGASEYGLRNNGITEGLTPYAPSEHSDRRTVCNLECIGGDGMDTRTIHAIVTLVIVLTVGSFYIGIGTVWSLVSNFTNLLPYILAGVVFAALGIRDRSIRSLIYWVICIGLFFAASK